MSNGLVCWGSEEQNKKAHLWLRNPRDVTAFQIHPEEIHRNDDDDDDDFSFSSRL